MNDEADLPDSAQRLPLSRATLHAALRRPLRVALFSGNYDCVRDGANQALNRLVAYLLDKVRAEVRIYSPTAPRKAFESVGDIRSVRSISIPGRPEYRVALGFPRATQQDFDGFAPDIVHLSAPDLLGRQAQKYALARGIPIVASLHTRFETYLDYYRLSFLRGPVDRYLDRFYGDCASILCPTLPIAREMGERFGTDRTAIWGRGIDPACFRPGLRDPALRTQLGYTAEDMVPLFFGRLVLEKGLGVFAEAVEAVRAQGLAVRPLIIGEGPARNWLAQRLPNATFMGHLTGAALGRAVASADMLINPSVTEAFGNVNLEAMASGLAVISADVPSASALIEDGRTGLLVPARNAAAYAAAAAALIRQPHRRAILGAAAAETAARHRWDDVLEDVVRSYAHVLRIPFPAISLVTAQAQAA
ncbi:MULTISPECIES: glycosyltransferase family 4 protein [Sphingobium]|uniref:Glycosyl transferase family 1 n=1 Tax=Sphingobium chungbukense TaxID=56193 RepID=A0A0M3AVI3_9SPHN|nr:MULTISPECIES: glycosyltransferase family 1 protein [Sphingobium]KKW93923.1 glycosyl transferase family 1 [Sphingobium chungbukense]PJG48364.1 glycosyl transferase family 1 [Sphingobium sp. LB126]